MNPALAFIVLIESRRFQRGLVAALSATALLLSGMVFVGGNPVVSRSA